MADDNLTPPYRERGYDSHPLEGGNGWQKEQKYVLETLKELKDGVRGLNTNVNDLRIEQKVLVAKVQLIGVIASMIISAVVSIVSKMVLK